MDIIMISGACCIPSMAKLDMEVRKIIDEAISLSGVQAKVSKITASEAFVNGAYRKLIKTGIENAPVIIIDGEVVSYGIPHLEDIKNALLQCSTKSKEE